MKRRTGSFPEYRKQSNSTAFKYRVDDVIEESESYPKDSDMKRCLICRMPNDKGNTQCRFCESENWDGRND